MDRGPVGINNKYPKPAISALIALYADIEKIKRIAINNDGF
jgi:hypothetical protein